MTPPRDAPRPLFSGFVPLTALARAGSVAVVLVLLVLFWRQQGFGWLAGALAGMILGGFVLGALYNPLRVGLGGSADPLSDPRLRRGASWAGGITGFLGAMILSAAVLRLSGQLDAARALLFTAALAVNLAYLPAKAACLAHGCCRAGAASPRWLARVPGDLRGVELAGTVLILLAMGSVQGKDIAALIGFSGHFALRLFALRQRGFALMPGRFVSDPGIELATLAASFALAASLG